MVRTVSQYRRSCVHPSNYRRYGSRPTLGARAKGARNAATALGLIAVLELPIALVGDFNVMPTEQDVYKPERWMDDALFRPEVRQALHELVAQGWVDSLRKLDPDERIYPFWDNFRNAWGRNAGLRIDHLLLSPELAKQLDGAYVDRWVRGWDHAPAWVTIYD